MPPRSLLLLTLLVAPTSVCIAENDPPPNIVLVFVDDMGYGDIGPFGSTKNQTPHLDRMAKEGLVLRQFYVSNTACTPSRSVLMTGTYASRIGMDGTVTFPGDRRGLHPNEITIAEMLKDRGYATGCFGKWHLGDQPDFLPTEQGFDEYFGIPYSNDMWPGNERGNPLTNRGKYTPLPVVRGEDVVAHVADGEDQALLAEVVTDEAVKFIRRHSNEPFFAYVPHAYVHLPRFARPDLLEKAEGDVTRAAIEEVDTSVGRILDTLHDLRIADRTLVLFTSDNGGARGTSMGPLRGGKGGPKYEGHMRVPTLAWWPGRIPAGRVSDEIAATVDLFPSLARLAGGTVPDDRVIDGADALDVLLGADDAASPHDVLFYETEGVRRGKWKLVAPPKGKPQLFDLDADVGEKRNLAAAHPDVVAELRALLAEHAKSLAKDVRPAGIVENPRPLIEAPGDLPNLRTYLASRTEASTLAPPLSPEESIASMEIQPGYHITPVLTEPTIHEPAAIAWDGNGRMYVVEMRTYMQDIDGREQLKPTSRVSRHEDTDGDGVYDRHTVFADNLALPRMVLPLIDRVIIRETNTLDLKSYRDTDGDGVADEITLWHEGGGRGGNLEHQPSGLIWNIDNWLYTTYSRHRYRVRGDEVVREPLPHGAGQWGLTHDDVGRIFYSSAGGENPATDFQRPIVYGRLSLPGEQAKGFREVFPIDNIPDTQGGRGRLRNDNTLNHFTASCGQSIFRGDRMPADLYGDLVICEPVGRLIRRAKVENDRGRIVVRNAYEGTEFIRSTDPNFRPVNSATGPDGCLYLVDMYRGIIQEGNWVRKGSYLRGVVSEYELDRNIGRGRIFRIEHETTKRGPAPRMLDERPAQLVAHLSHPNGWWRSEAQKLIVLHGDDSVVPALRELATSGESPLGRLHALWTLEGLDAADAELLGAAMSDGDPRVRAAAIRIAEESIDEDRTLDEPIAKLSTDDDPDVAIQALLSIGRGGHPDAETLTASILETHDDNDAVKGIANQVRAQLEKLIAERKRIEEIRRRNELLAESIVRGKLTYTTLCINCHGPDGKGRPAPDGKGLMLAPPLAGSPRVRGHRERLVRVVLDGLIGPVDGKTYAGGLMLPMKANDDQWIADVTTYIRNSFGNEAPLIEARDVAAIREASRERSGPWTLAELKPFDPPSLNRGNWKLTASHGGDKVGSAVDGNKGSRWDTGITQRPGMWFGIELPEPLRVLSLELDAGTSTDDYPRGYSVRVSADGETWSEPVAEGRGSTAMTVIELAGSEPVRHIRIDQTGTSGSKYWSIHELSIKGLTGREPKVRSLAETLAALDPAELAAEALENGDARRGAAIFYNQAFSCAKCHDPRGGERIGPDLASKRDGVTGKFLVESILHPSKDIRKGFEPLTVLTAEGLTVTGFPIADTEEGLVLLEPGGRKLEIARDDIEFTKKGTTSVMPVGLANQLPDRKHFLDLVRFLVEINVGGPDRLKELKPE